MMQLHFNFFCIFLIRSREYYFQIFCISSDYWLVFTKGHLEMDLFI